MWKQAAFLNDIADTAAQLFDVLGRNAHTVEADGAAIGFYQSNDEPKQGRFAATAGPDQHGGLATRHRQIRGLQRRRIRVTFADVNKLNQRVHAK